MHHIPTNKTFFLIHKCTLARDKKHLNATMHKRVINRCTEHYFDKLTSALVSTPIPSECAELKWDCLHPKSFKKLWAMCSQHHANKFSWMNLFFGMRLFLPQLLETKLIKQKQTYSTMRVKASRFRKKSLGQHTARAHHHCSIILIGVRGISFNDRLLL